MAALDFGMALARGMLPKAKEAQEELLFRAGGRNVFKSEDWWNKQVDKQISEGYGQKETGTEYLTKSGEYVLGKRTRQPAQMYDFSGPRYAYNAPKGAVITGYTTPPRNVLYAFPQPIYETRQVEVFGGAAGTEYFTAGELKDIEASAKRGAEEAKRETAASKAARKRLARGTGGLVGKAVGPDTTGLPSLGSGGLGVTASLLGTETKL